MAYARVISSGACSSGSAAALSSSTRNSFRVGSIPGSATSVIPGSETLWRKCRPSAPATITKSADAASGTAIFDAGQRPIGSGLYLRVIGRPAGVLVPDGQRPARLAARHRLEPSRALLLGAGRGQHQRRARRREPRAGRKRVAHLLGDHHKLDGAEAESALILGDDHPGPSELDELLPLLVGEPAVVLGELAHRRQRIAGGQELAGGPLDRLLVVGESEVHLLGSFALVCAVNASAGAPAPARRRCSSRSRSSRPRSSWRGNGGSGRSSYRRPASRAARRSPSLPRSTTG